MRIIDQPSSKFSATLALLVTSIFLALATPTFSQDTSTETEPLFIQKWFVPPSMVQAWDPMQLDGNSRKKLSPQKAIEEAGITFSPGAFATYNHFTGELAIINTADQLNLCEIYLGYGWEHEEKQITTITERIEIESALYHDWMFENRMTGDSTPLRKQVQEWVKAGRGSILETSVVLTRSGQRAKTESVREVAYPVSDGDPSELPSEVIAEGNRSKVLMTGRVPNAFTTRKIGSVLTADPVLGASDSIFDLNVSQETITLSGYTHWPPKGTDPLHSISKPNFHLQKATSEITANSGAYYLIGTTKPLKSAVESRKKPIILVFVRANVSKFVLDEGNPLKRRPFPKK